MPGGAGPTDKESLLRRAVVVVLSDCTWAAQCGLSERKRYMAYSGHDEESQVPITMPQGKK